MKKNGTFKRGIFFLLDGVLTYKRIRIQTLLWSKASGERVYISIFPSNVIKYNKVDTGLIEFISTNVREGEDVFKHVDDSLNTLDCEDMLINSCERVERSCVSRRLSALLCSRFTETFNETIKVMNFSDYLNMNCRFKEIYLLLKTARHCNEYGVLKSSNLSSLNLIFKFLR